MVGWVLMGLGLGLCLGKGRRREELTYYLID